LRASANTLNRALGYWDLIAYGVAYIAPMAIFSTLGFVWTESRGLIALAYVLGSVCMYFTAKSYAVMTESVPTAGSVYGFARHATAAISLAVALAMRNLVDELASIVNFGALSGFLLLHISVLAKFVRATLARPDHALAYTARRHRGRARRIHRNESARDGSWNQLAADRRRVRTDTENAPSRRACDRTLILSVTDGSVVNVAPLYISRTSCHLA
jgi:hypothetical protein